MDRRNRPLRHFVGLSPMNLFSRPTCKSQMSSLIASHSSDNMLKVLEELGQAYNEMADGYAGDEVCRDISNGSTSGYARIGSLG